MDELLLAAAIIALAEKTVPSPWEQGRAYVLSLEGHGRVDAFEGTDLSRTVGWFTTEFPVRLDMGNLSPDAFWTDGKAVSRFLSAVTEQLQAVPDDGLGFGLLRYLNPLTTPILAACDRPEFAFNYLGRLGRTQAGDWDVVADDLALWSGGDSDLALIHPVEANVFTAEHPEGPRLTIHWSWARSLASQEWIESLSSDWFRAIERIVHSLQESGQKGYGYLPSVRPSSGTFCALQPGPGDFFEARLCQIWQGSLNLSPIGIQTPFLQAGGDPMLAARHKLLVKRAFGIDLSLEDILQSPTIEQLATTLRRLQKLQSQTPLVILRESGNASPLFLVHPAGGGVMCYHDLSQALHSNHPVLGLAYQGFQKRPGDGVEIEEMAALYVKTIRASWPDGPYYLGGWSLGGTIAFEMARQLEAAGQVVCATFVIDQVAPRAAWNRQAPSEDTDLSLLTSIVRKLELQFGTSLDISVDELGPMGTKERLEFVLDRMKARDLLPAYAETSSLSDFLETYKHHLQASQRYRPGRLAGRLVLIRGEQVHPDIRLEDPEAYQDLHMGWQSYCASSVEALQVPGDHLSIVRPPYVQKLASEMQRYLSNSQGETHHG